MTPPKLNSPLNAYFIVRASWTQRVIARKAVWKPNMPWEMVRQWMSKDVVYLLDRRDGAESSSGRGDPGEVRYRCGKSTGLEVTLFDLYKHDLEGTRTS
jgi:hypothetical protein